MPRLARFFLLTASAALLAGCAPKAYLHWQGGEVFGVTDAEAGSPSPIECSGTTEQRFACFAELLRSRADRTSGAFAVVTAEGALLESSVTEPRQTVATSADTPFPVGSVTKMFTAAAALMLARDGLLDLHRPIAAYLPEIGADTELGRVTVDQLLSHTAGLLDPLDQPPCAGDGELSGALARAHLGAPPGAVYLYSNTGYALVGLVLERITARRFEDVMRERVFDPMGMTSATFDGSSLDVRGHADLPGLPLRCRVMNPSGGLIASASDLARWAQAMMDPATHPLGPAIVDALTTARVATGERPGETYGYGVKVFEHGGVRVFHHAGNLEDFSAFVAWVPARRFASVAMANRSGASPAVAVLRGLGVFLDLPNDWRPSLDGQQRTLAAYAGTYVDRRGKLGRVRVRVDGDRLAYDYLDGKPALLPATFRFHFAPDEARARYVVTVVGVGERVEDGAPDLPVRR